MYFPDNSYIPFFRELDKCVLKYANESSFKQYGSRLVEVASEQVRLNPELERHFTSLIRERFQDYTSTLKEAVQDIYLEMIRKLSNTRIQEFLDSHCQVAAKTDGSSTLSGQN